MKKIIILGVTGSIGSSALSVLDNFKDEFHLAGMSANTNVSALKKISSLYPEANIVITSKTSENENLARQNGWGCGPESLLTMIKESDADIILNGISGAAGLAPSLAALESGKDLALANKESMVVAGSLVKKTASRHHCRIFPVDSEHSAVFSLLADRKKEEVSEIILTASGGAFKNKTKEELTKVTLKEALTHPTWEMGAKITIDSASLANKGLEVIEACRLFDFQPSRVKVVIHPQSIVHSFIRLNDGALYAQLSRPSMVLPIQNALTWPEIKNVPGIRLDFDELLNLDFFPPDTERFPMLPLAYQSLEAGESYTAVYNAANEVAVEAFRQEKISFMQIPAVTEYALQQDYPKQFSTLEEILEIDSSARRYALKKIGGSL